MDIGTSLLLPFLVEQHGTDCCRLLGIAAQAPIGRYGCHKLVRGRNHQLFPLFLRGRPRINIQRNGGDASLPACMHACMPVHIPGLTWILTPLYTLVGCLDSQAMGVINDLFEARKKADKDRWQGHTLGPGPSPLTTRQESTL